MDGPKGWTEHRLDGSGSRVYAIRRNALIELHNNILLEKSYTKYMITANKHKSKTNQTDELRLVCADAIDNVLQFIGNNTFLSLTRTKSYIIEVEMKVNKNERSWFWRSFRGRRTKKLVACMETWCMSRKLRSLRVIQFNHRRLFFCILSSHKAHSALLHQRASFQPCWSKIRLLCRVIEANLRLIFHIWSQACMRPMWHN